MVEAQRELTVARRIDDVWEFVSDMGQWAAQMPGYVSHERINDDESIWTLKIDMGPFTRPVVVDVRVLRWTPPTGVEFVLKGRQDPFHGSGRYEAQAVENGTRIGLEFSVQATGSMSKVLNAMCIPVLKHVADEFSANLGKVLNTPSDAPVATGSSTSEAQTASACGWGSRLRKKLGLA